jgi:hypothetical protein
MPNTMQCNAMQYTQCTVMITIRQALQKIGLLSSEAEETTLYQRLNVLLRDSSVGMKDIVAEAVRFVRVAKEASRGKLDLVRWKRGQDRGEDQGNRRRGGA